MSNWTTYGLTSRWASHEVVVDKRLHPMKGHHPIPHPLSEQKIFRGYISDIVDEKNQKKWKLLPEKTGRLIWKENDLPLESLCSPVAPA